MKRGDKFVLVGAVGIQKRSINSNHIPFAFETDVDVASQIDVILINEIPIVDGIAKMEYREVVVIQDQKFLYEVLPANSLEHQDFIYAFRNHLSPF